jgi:hypothetical protein
MQMTTKLGRTELQQSRTDVLALPIFIGVILLAVLVRQFIPPDPSPIVLAVCGVCVALDVWLARWLQHRGAATMVVTADQISVVPPGAAGSDAAPQVLNRTPDTTLSFRLQRNGFVGNQITYLLKLHDNATGAELSVTTFGKRNVRRACEAQHWQFGDDQPTR